MAPHRKLGLLGRMTRRRSEGQVNVLSSEGHLLHVQQGFEDLQDEAQGIKHDKLQHTWKLLNQHKDAAARQRAEAAALVIQRAARAFRKRRRVLRLVREFVVRLKQAVLATRAAGQQEGIDDENAHCELALEGDACEDADAASTASTAVCSRQTTPRGSHSSRQPASRQRARIRIPSSGGASISSPRSLLLPAEADVQLCSGVFSRPHTAQRTAACSTLGNHEGLVQQGTQQGSAWDGDDAQQEDGTLETEPSDTISYRSASTIHTAHEMPRLFKRLGRQGLGSTTVQRSTGTYITAIPQSDLTCGSTSVPASPPRQQFGFLGLVPVMQPQEGLLQLHVSQFVGSSRRPLHSRQQVHTQAAHADVTPWGADHQVPPMRGVLSVEGCTLSQQRARSQGGGLRGEQARDPCCLADCRPTAFAPPSWELRPLGASSQGSAPPGQHGANAVGIVQGTQVLHQLVDALRPRSSSMELPSGGHAHSYQGPSPTEYICDPQLLHIAGIRPGTTTSQRYDVVSPMQLLNCRYGVDASPVQVMHTIDTQHAVHASVCTVRQAPGRSGRRSPTRNNGRALLPTAIVTDPSTGSLVDQNDNSAPLTCLPGPCEAYSRASATSVNTSVAGSLQCRATASQPAYAMAARNARSADLRHWSVQHSHCALPRYTKHTQYSYAGHYSCPPHSEHASLATLHPQHADSAGTPPAGSNLLTTVCATHDISMHADHGPHSEPLYLSSGQHAVPRARRGSGADCRVCTSTPSPSLPGLHTSPSQISSSTPPGFSLPRIALSKSADTASGLRNVMLQQGQRQIFGAQQGDDAVLGPATGFVMQAHAVTDDFQSDGFRFFRVL